MRRSSFTKIKNVYPARTISNVAKKYSKHLSNFKTKARPLKVVATNYSSKYIWHSLKHFRKNSFTEKRLCSGDQATVKQS